MAKLTRSKSATLTLTAKRKIAEYYLNHNQDGNTISYQETARLFTNDKQAVTVSQVQYAVEQYRKDKLKVKTRGSKAINKRAQLLAENKTTDELVDEQLKLLVAQIKADDKMSTADKANMLAHAVTLQEKHNKNKLEKHMKSLDASFLFALIRKFKPDCTEQEAIKVCYEVRETLK